MENTEVQELIHRISRDMRHAMKSRNRVEASELKSLLARISNAEAVPIDRRAVDDDGSPIAGAMSGVGSSEVARKELTMADIRSILNAEEHEIQTTLSSLDGQGEYAAELAQKLAVVQRYY